MDPACLIQTRKVKRELETMRIRLLGGFRVSVGARTTGEEGWRLKRARSLVKLLALSTGHRLHRDQIVERLWPDSSPGSAANSLRQAVHVARRALGADPGTDSGFLRFVEGWLELCPDGDLWVDVEAFEEAAAVARRSQDPAPYLVAIDLYAGDLLPQDRYEAWAEHRREGLRRTYLGLLLKLGELYEKRGEPELAIEILGRALEAEPAHEGANLALMRLYASDGRSQEAILQYERLRKALSEGLGGQPEEATRYLYERIRALHADARPLAESSRVAAPSGRLRQHNLPAERTSFVGRDREIVEVERLLSMTRVLSLTGAGGSGKTRFAMTVAKRVVDSYPDGVWFVELASLSVGTLIPQAVIAVLDVEERPDEPVISTLKQALHRRKLLLVLDNCEHLIEASAWLVETLLDSCPGLRVLATSREALNVAGELVWSVAPLSVPEEGHPSAIEEVAGYEAVRLFAERARYRDPTFELSPGNLEAVATVCRQLDGMPLAIELVAAKVGGLSVGQIAERLEGSLGLLAGGNRTAPPRQQTLEGALDWSYDLLTGSERDLFGRLSVFSGGWTLGAAEAIGSEDGIDKGGVIGLLLRLVDKSLVVAEANGGGGEPRYRMLETVRQYASEKLGRSGEEEEALQRHAAYFVRLAEEAEQGLNGSDHGRWLVRLETEHDNLRAALSWLLGEGGDVPSGVQLAAAMWPFWFARGYLSEGRRWLEGAASRAGPAATAARAKALNGAGSLATFQEEYGAAKALIEEALAISRELGDKEAIASSLANLCGVAMLGQRDDIPVTDLLEEAFRLRPTLEDRRTAGNLYILEGRVALARGDLARSVELGEDGLSLYREAGDDYGMVMCLLHVGFVTLKWGEYDRTTSVLQEGLRLSGKLDHKTFIQYCLTGLAGVAASRGWPARAARLWGAEESMSEAFGGRIVREGRATIDYEGRLAEARSQLDGSAWAAAWTEGRTMTPEQAIEYALSEEKSSSLVSVQASGDENLSEALTPREREIALFVARELTNRQIARELTISERTVTTHVHRILKKLGLRSRTHISAWVMEQQLHER
jgi:predicted ATPase/DNA-binding SARP family transcriptional activator/DNA-binding CsgD family transcriptional regulator